MVLRFLFLFLLLLSSCVRRVPLQSQNFAHSYNREFPVRVQFKVLEAGADLQVFMQVQFFKLEGIKSHLQIWERYNLTYVITPSYTSRRRLQSDTLHPSERIWPSQNPLVLAIKIPKSKENRVFALHISEKYSNEDFIFNLQLNKASESDNYKVCLFSTNGRIPVFDPYISTSDTVVLRTLEFDTSKIGKIEFHPFNSSLALPPMAAVATSGNDFEESYPVQAGMNKHVVFKQPGYYYIPTLGGVASSGFGFVVTEPYFPLVTTPEELIDPMAYISTRDERKTLFQASNQKQALDDFWLKIQNQKEQARKLIRKYFENIEEANRLFTTHKAGWKTDKGMVMAIYGPPALVRRDWDSEIWQYEKAMGGEGTIFYFTRNPSEKDPNNWELKRYSEYDRVWYGVVDLWRKGVINR